MKIYDVRGATVFSTEAKQIGENKSGNQGYQTALASRLASELTHRDTFSAFEQTIEDRDVLSTYIPVLIGQERKVQAVFEIYDDVTPLLARVSLTQKKVMLGVALVLTTLYAILFLIVYHADNVLRRQHEAHLLHEEALSAARDSLEQRVRDRTAELQHANAALLLEVDERRNAQLKLSEAKRIADDASEAKTQFLANMSHEIRTPMNGMLGMVELLRLDGDLNSEQRENVETIRHSSIALMRIIDDILDISKIEAGKFELEHIAFDFRRIVKQVIDLHTPRATVKGLQLEYDLAVDLPTKLYGDHGRLRQVLNNLVSNAVKFTQHGRISLQAAVDAASERLPLTDHVLVRFEVSDTGIGVTDDVRRRLFAPFSQGDASFSRAYGGTGLGLAISKKLVEMMGGEIGVDSRPGIITTFWFTVWLECRSTAEAEASTRDEIVQATRVTTVPVVELESNHMRVLVAEDDAVSQTVVSRMLHTLGCVPTVVSNGEEAVRALKQENFQILLMDCHMPGMNGFEATAAIRREELEQVPPEGDVPLRIPIIAFTANAMHGARERCLAAGMDDFIAKPVRMDALREVLSRWLPTTAVAPAATRLRK